MENERIKNNIRSYRLEKGLRQDQLAERAGVNQASISQYEAGKFYPNIPTALKLSKALGKSVNELYN